MNLLPLALVLLPRVWPQLLGGLLLQIIPDLMRPGLFFGVTVDPQFKESAAARATRRRYSLTVWVATLIAIALGIITAFSATGASWAPTALAVLTTRPALRPIPWLLQFAIALWAYVRANRAARPHAMRPASVVQMELPTKPEPTPAIVAVLSLPLASLGVLATWTGINWRHIPDRLAVHWDVTGPDRWAATTPTSVSALLALYGVMCLLLALFAWGVMQGSRHVATRGEAAARERRFRRRNLALLIIAEYFAVFPPWATLLALPPSAMQIWAATFPAAILVMVGTLLFAGQGGSRGLAVRGGAPVGDRTDDRYWTWGLIYFNRADPAFLIEKRFGVGYTVNLGHPFAWALLVLIVAITLISRLI